MIVPEPPISLVALLPELLLLVGGCVVLLLGQTGPGARRSVAPWATLATLIVSISAVLLEPRLASFVDNMRYEGNGLAFGSLALFIRKSALELGIILTLVHWSLARTSERGEFLAMLLFSLAGVLLVAAADNLLVLFLALELVSIPTYILVVLSRSNPRALEAGTKYFYLGALAAAVIAYGFSFLYGVSGTASLDGVYASAVRALQQPGTLEYGLTVAGVVLAFGGLLFKISAVPLHFYVADVYQGAASPVAGLLGFVPKAAGFVAIFKIVVLTGHWDGADSPVFWVLWIVAVVSMCVGNTLALRQTNIKRMLAYSGIAHSGYMLVGVLAGPFAGKAVSGEGVSIFGDGPAAVLYYVVVYGIANLGAFAVLGLLRAREQACETLRDVSGLLRRHPGQALLLVFVMFTLMGLPPTPGFWGKLSLFGSVLTGSRLAGVAGREAWMVALVIIAVLNTALSAAYYLRVIAAVLLYENKHPAAAAPREAEHIGALLCGFLLLLFTFFPSLLMTPGKAATAELGEQDPASLTRRAADVRPGLSRSAIDGSGVQAERDRPTGVSRQRGS